MVSPSMIKIPIMKTSFEEKFDMPCLKTSLLVGKVGEKKKKKKEKNTSGLQAVMESRIASILFH
jgi:hypothetical protein